MGTWEADGHLRPVSVHVRLLGDRTGPWGRLCLAKFTQEEGTGGH